MEPSTFAGIATIGATIAAIVLGIFWQSKHDMISWKLRHGDKAGAQMLMREAEKYGTAALSCLGGAAFLGIATAVLRIYDH